LFLSKVSIFFFIGSDVHFHVGHIRNIHFPFDIEADTSTSVASEMVEELELTDQDVTTIARMIDSEIRFHIPSWNVSEIPVDSYSQDSSYTSESRPEASSVKLDSVPSPGSLALEILPSGRKFWSDSPKGVGASKFCFAADANAEEGSLARNGDISADDRVGDCSDEIGDSLSSKRSIKSGATSEKSPLNETSGSVKDSETEYINLIATKLENLLIKQREELDELKRKHELAVSDLLKELSPEISQKVLNICNLQVPGREM